MKSSDAILGGAAILLGGAVYLNTLSFPAMKDGSPGPALFPQILAIFLAIFGFIVVFQSVRPHVNHSVHYDRSRVLKAGLVLVGIAVFILVIKTVGFVITATVLMFGMTLLLGAKPWVGFAASAGTAIGCVLLFERVLRVPLPLGSLLGA